VLCLTSKFTVCASAYQSSSDAFVHLAPDGEPVTWSSMPHSFLPRTMRKKPFSPQYGFQLFATFQYLVPFPTPHPTILTA
jgi:hypothetical protein